MSFFSSIPEIKGNLRQHQIDAKRKIFEAWDHYDSVMLQMPTGTGKTYLFTSLINDLLTYYKNAHRELHILIVAHRTELLDQISISLSRYSIPHGFVQGSREQQLWQRVQVGSIQSMLSARNYVNTVRQRFDYIIVDEAHHSLAETYKQLFSLFPDAKKLGVTATPWRLNHESFLALYQTLVTTPQVSWFIDHHLLADFDYVSIKPDSEMQRMINHTEVSQTGDFVNIELDRAFNNQRIRSHLYSSYEQYAKERKGIIYAINKEHAYNIAHLYSSKGVSAVAIDCDTPKDERKRSIEDFKNGIIKVLVNVEIFTEGFDCPDVSFIQLARPTRSLALYLQQVGRGLRVMEGNGKTIIIDNVGLYNYFGLPDANRMWQYHFKGHDVLDAQSTATSGLAIGEREYSPRCLEEGNEEMVVVKGHKEPQKKNISTRTPKDNPPEPISEFILCDYYLVHGNSKHFKVYPLVKKHGKITQGVSGCVLDYDAMVHPLAFSVDPKDNQRVIASDVRIQNIVSFVSTLCKMNTKELLQKCCDPGSSLFGLFQKIGSLYSESQKR